MIGLKDEEVASGEFVSDGGRGATEVGRDAEFDAGIDVADRDGHGIGGIVHGQERTDLEGTDAERTRRLVFDDPFLPGE